MGVAALISWFVTAFVGLYLLAVWLIENDVTHEGATASRLPAPVILAHVLLAVTGLVIWVIHLLSGSASWGWVAVGLLAGIAALGLTMFTRGSRSTPRSWRPNPPGAFRPTSTSRPSAPFPRPSSSATVCSRSRR